MSDGVVHPGGGAIGGVLRMRMLSRKVPVPLDFAAAEMAIGAIVDKDLPRKEGLCRLGSRCGSEAQHTSSGWRPFA